MDQEEAEEAVIAAVTAPAVARVAVPTSAEGIVKFRNVNFNWSSIMFYYINIYWSCLFKSKPIAFTGYFHLIYYPTTLSHQQ